MQILVADFNYYLLTFTVISSTMLVSCLMGFLPDEILDLRWVVKHQIPLKKYDVDRAKNEMVSFLIYPLHFYSDSARSAICITLCHLEHLVYWPHVGGPVPFSRDRPKLTSKRSHTYSLDVFLRNNSISLYPKSWFLSWWFWETRWGQPVC